MSFSIRGDVEHSEEAPRIDEGVVVYSLVGCFSDSVSIRICSVVVAPVVALCTVVPSVRRCVKCYLDFVVDDVVLVKGVVARLEYIKAVYRIV